MISRGRGRGRGGRSRGRGGFGLSYRNTNDSHEGGSGRYQTILKKCFNCNIIGHNAGDCPFPPICHRCFEKGYYDSFRIDIKLKNANPTNHYASNADKLVTNHLNAQMIEFAKFAVREVTELLIALV